MSPKPVIIEARRRLADMMDRKVERKSPFPALLGTQDGTVAVPDVSGYVYVRIGKNESIGICYNKTVPNIPNLPVLVGYSFEEPQLFQVLTTLQQNYGASMQTPYPTVQEHHKTHEWDSFGAGGGNDIVYTSIRQWTPLRVSVSTGFTISVNAGTILRSGSIQYLAAQTLDLTAYKPASNSCYVLVYLDSAGVVGAVAGASVIAGSLTLADCPLPTANQFALAAVRMYSSQTAISDTPSAADIQDLRWPQLSLPSGGTLGNLDSPLLLSGGVCTEYTTIQAAITAASAGDEVWIPPGTYTEEVTLKSGVSVWGFGNRDDIIVKNDSADLTQIASVQTAAGACTCTVQNITMQTVGNAGGDTGAFVAAHTSGIVTLLGCKFLCDSAANQGHGITVADAGGVVVDGFDIIGGALSAAGNFGVDNTVSATVELRHGKISGNILYTLTTDGAATIQVYDVEYDETKVQSAAGTLLFQTGDRLARRLRPTDGAVDRGHVGHWGRTIVDGTAITLIPNATGDVTKLLTAIYAVAELGGTDTGGGAISLAPSESSPLCDDGANTLTLAVAADGSVTVQRTAGAETYDVSLWLTWI